MRYQIITLTFFLIFAFNSCTSTVKSDVISLITKNKLIRNNDRVTFEIINNSNIDYFIILDTIRYNDIFQNYKVNKTLRPVAGFFLQNDSTQIIIQSAITKNMSFNKLNEECKRIEKTKSLEFMSKLKHLENLTILKRNSVSYISIPFSINYTICDIPFIFEFDKEKLYFVQFRYNMDKSVIENIVPKAKIKQLHDKGILPYYGNLMSNKTKLVLN